MDKVATDAPRLMATAVAKHSCRRLPKRLLERHVADVKIIAGDDEATLRVNQNSANIMQSFKIFIYEFLVDALRLTAASRVLKLNVTNVKNVATMIW